MIVVALFAWNCMEDEDEGRNPPLASGDMVFRAYNPAVATRWSFHRRRDWRIAPEGSNSAMAW